jgi:hypothetical protein
MSEIVGYLKSPGWWFATVFVAFAVNVASGIFVDALRSGKIKLSGDKTVRYALLAHGLLTLLVSVATGFGSLNPERNTISIMMGAASCFFIV